MRREGLRHLPGIGLDDGRSDHRPGASSEVQALSDRFLAAVAREPSAVADGPAAEGPAIERAADGIALAPAQPTAEELEWGELAGLLEARRFPNRRRCASLSWEILQRALSG